MIYFRKSRQSGIAVFKVRADNYSLWALQLLFDRPPIWSDIGDGKQQRGSRGSIFLFLTGFQLCDSQPLWPDPDSRRQNAVRTRTVREARWDYSRLMIWQIQSEFVRSWCLMQTGDRAEAAARAAADSEGLALLSYHKNRVSFCHGLEFPVNLFPSFSF